jgi:hypothetical protein
VLWLERSWPEKVQAAGSHSAARHMWHDESAEQVHSQQQLWLLALAHVI